jgi:hypothetical protein
LVPLLEDWCRFELDFFLYYSSRRQMPPPLQTLIAFIRKHAHGGANAKTASLGRPHEHDRDAATA